MRHVTASGFASLSEPWASVVIGVIAIVAIAWIAVLVAVAKSILRSRMDTGMKVVWIVLIMTTHLLGVVLWFLVGRHHTDQLAT